MNIETTQKEFGKIVKGVARLVQKNPQLPVLGAIMCIAEKGSVRIQATNLEIGVEYILPAKVITEGVVAVPAHILSSYVSTFSGDKKVQLEVVGETLHVRAGEGNTKIKTVPHEDFPTLPKVEDGSTFSLPAKKLTASLESVVFCASPSMIRPELASVYLEGTDEGLTSVATDSFRLAEKKVPVNNAPVFEPILVPAKNVTDILNFIDESENVAVALNEHNITFDTGKGFITSRLTSGNFPDYTQILPKEFSTHATVLSQDVIDVLKKISIFSDTFNKTVVTVNPSQKEFTFTAQNADVGETVEQVSGALEGDEITISFNHRYIADVFSVLKADSTHFSFAGNQKPLLIEGVGDTSFLYIVMPMNR